MAHAILIAMIAYYVVGLIAVITQVGKPKRPTEPGAAAVYAVLCFALIAGQAYVYTQLR